MRYTTLHHTPLHYTICHYTTFHFSTLHYTTLQDATLHNTTQHYTTLQCTAQTTTPTSMPIAETCFTCPKVAWNNYRTWLELKWVKLSRRKCSNSFRVRVVRSGSNVVKHSVEKYVPKYSRCVNNLWDAWDVKGIISEVEGSRPRVGTVKCIQKATQSARRWRQRSGRAGGADRQGSPASPAPRAPGRQAKAEGQGAVREVAGAGRAGGVGHRRWTAQGQAGVQVEVSAAGSSVKKRASKTRQSRSSKRLAQAQWAATA